MNNTSLMTNLTRTTVYLKPHLHQALKIRAAQTSKSMSDLLNETLTYELAEDLEDIQDLEAERNEPTMSYEEFLTALKADGLI